MSRLYMATGNRHFGILQQGCGYHNSECSVLNSGFDGYRNTLPNRQQQPSRQCIPESHRHYIQGKGNRSGKNEKFDQIFALLEYGGQNDEYKKKTRPMPS